MFPSTSPLPTIIKDDMHEAKDSTIYKQREGEKWKKTKTKQQTQSKTDSQNYSFLISSLLCPSKTSFLFKPFLEKEC